MSDHDLEFAGREHRGTEGRGVKEPGAGDDNSPGTAHAMMSDHDLVLAK